MLRCIFFITRIWGSMGSAMVKEYFKKSGAEIPQEFTVTAHTGALLTKRNSVKSVITSIKACADIIEVDVTFRKDGTVVIIHSDSPADNEGVLFEKTSCPRIPSTRWQASRRMRPTSMKNPPA